MGSNEPNAAICLFVNILSDICNSHNVGKYTGGSHACTSTIALYEHWILLLALSGEQYDVVAALEVVERMALVDLAE